MQTQNGKKKVYKLELRQVKVRQLDGQPCKKSLKTAEVKVHNIPLGDNPSGTAGQKTLRDAPVAIKRRRRFVCFLLVTFLCTSKEK